MCFDNYLHMNFHIHHGILSGNFPYNPPYNYPCNYSHTLQYIGDYTIHNKFHCN